jgi:hypothetical protein
MKATLILTKKASGTPVPIKPRPGAFNLSKGSVRIEKMKSAMA